MHAGALHACAATSQREGVVHVWTAFQPVWAELQISRVAPLHWYSPGVHGAGVHSCIVALQSATLAQALTVA